jgi:hypothetical protein
VLELFSRLIVEINVRKFIEYDNSIKDNNLIWKILGLRPTLITKCIIPSSDQGCCIIVPGELEYSLRISVASGLYLGRLLLMRRSDVLMPF